MKYTYLLKYSQAPLFSWNPRTSFGSCPPFSHSFNFFAALPCKLEPSFVSAICPTGILAVSVALNIICLLLASKYISRAYLLPELQTHIIDYATDTLTLICHWNLKLPTIKSNYLAKSNHFVKSVSFLVLPISVIGTFINPFSSTQKPFHFLAQNILSFFFFCISLFNQSSQATFIYWVKNSLDSWIVFPPPLFPFLF